VRSTW